MPENLERRIAAALADDAITSVALSKLVEETDAAIIAADASAEKERTKALDPALSPDPKAARQAMEDAAFAADRLRTLLPRLQRRHQSVTRAERKAEWVKKYDAIKLEHDAAVAELKQLYPTVVAPLVGLLSRIRELDARAKAVRDAKPFLEFGEPDDGRRLLPVECAARGMASLYPPESTLDRGLVLPDFNQPGKNAWPPYEVPFGVQVALAMKRYC